MGQRTTTPAGSGGGPASGQRVPPGSQQTLDDREDERERTEQEIEESHEDYAERAKVTDRQGEKMAERKENVVDNLKDDMKVKDSSIYGSVMQQTVTRPIDEDTDVDVLVVLDENEHSNWTDDPNGPRNALRSVKNTLEKKYPNHDVYIDRNVVTVEFSDFKVEVAPAFEHSAVYDPSQPGGAATPGGIELPFSPWSAGNQNDGYVIPDTYGGQSWVGTNPRKFQSMYDAVNNSHNGKLQQVAVTAKRWNEKNGKPVNSFHMVNMAYRYFENEAPDNASLNQHMHNFFQRLPRYIQTSTEEPVYGERVDEGMSSEERRKAAGKAAKDSEKLQEAHRLKEEGKTEEAKEKYREVYGDDFK